jgi:hypothetical protein
MSCLIPPVFQQIAMQKPRRSVETADMNKKRGTLCVSAPRFLLCSRILGSSTRRHAALRDHRVHHPADNRDSA